MLQEHETPLQAGAHGARKLLQQTLPQPTLPQPACAPPCAPSTPDRLISSVSPCRSFPAGRPEDRVPNPPAGASSRTPSRRTGYRRSPNSLAGPRSHRPHPMGLHRSPPQGRRRPPPVGPPRQRRHRLGCPRAPLAVALEERCSGEGGGPTGRATWRARDVEGAPRRDGLRTQLLQPSRAGPVPGGGDHLRASGPRRSSAVDGPASPGSSASLAVPPVVEHAARPPTLP